MRSSITLDTRQLASFAQRYAGAEQVIAREITDTLTSIVIQGETEAKRRAPRDTGNLQRDLTHDVRPLGSKLEGWFGLKQGNAPYGQYVEFGTPLPPAGGTWRPGPRKPPPAQKLYEWAKRRGQYNPMGGPAGSDKEFWSVAFRVQKKIARYGTKPQPFLGPAFDEVLPVARRKFDALPQNVFKKLRGSS